MSLGNIVFDKTWPDFKVVVSAKKLKLQYEDKGHLYELYCFDGPVSYKCELIKDFDTIKVPNLSEAEANLEEFESSYKPFANEKLEEAAQSDRAKLVAIVGREGSETVWATHNYCDATTWYGSSERVTETLSPNESNTVFSGSNPFWIDMTHGKVLDETGLSLDVEHGYSIVVTVDGVEQPVHDPFNNETGTYTINYRSGSIEFTSPVTGSVVASYSHATDNVWVLAPLSGRALDVEQAKINFTEDLTVSSPISYVVYGYVDVFAPEYSSAYGGPIPSGTKIEIARSTYSSLTQIVDEAVKINPMLPAIGSPGSGLPSATYSAVFRYSTLRRLWHKYGMELRIMTRESTEIQGTRATGTFYCVSRPEAELE